MILFFIIYLINILLFISLVLDLDLEMNKFKLFGNKKNSMFIPIIQLKKKNSFIL